jgi:hypothetical protein
MEIRRGYGTTDSELEPTRLLLVLQFSKKLYTDSESVPLGVRVALKTWFELQVSWWHGPEALRGDIFILVVQIH